MATLNSTISAIEGAWDSRFGAAKDRRAYAASKIYKLMQNNPDITYGEATQIVYGKIKANARASRGY